MRKPRRGIGRRKPTKPVISLATKRVVGTLCLGSEERASLAKITLLLFREDQLVRHAYEAHHANGQSTFFGHFANQRRLS
jgi:hypothetical protein